MRREITIGIAVVAGAAVLEAALVPGILLGAAALLAPRLLSGRRSKANGRTIKSTQIGKAASRDVAVRQPPEPFVKSQFGRAIAKTITFRIIVTTLDFSTNYIVIGEFATAAGLSTFNLIAGPIFYFGHEAVWNYLGPAESGVTLNLPNSNPDKDATSLTISPALAKTITYRTIATVIDFTTNYVVVGNAAQAVILSATGFLFGPFVYYGHEKAWEYLAGDSRTKSGPVIDLLPVAG